MGAAERDREQILARRRLLVASALAGVVASGCDQCSPKPCLEPPPVSTTPAVPGPCLSQAMPLDAGEVAPQPCLEVAPAPTADQTPAPKVCLRVAVPRGDGGPPNER